MRQKTYLVSLLAVGVLLNNNPLNANELEVTGNIGTASNYIWRGMTQTKDDFQTSAGIDLSYNEFYFGTWGSNVDFGDDANYEVDFYLGYTNSLNEFTYDLSYFYYTYPNSSAELNLQEATISLGYSIDPLSFNFSHSFATKLEDSSAKKLDYSELSISYDFDVFSINSSFGDYEETGTNYSVGINKIYKLSDGSLDINLIYSNFEHETDSKKDEENLYTTATYSF